MSHMAALRWDLFCRVIDNYGDIGVCWRLAADLGARGHTVRLWVDDASALAWMAPRGAPGVQVLAWPEHAPTDGPPDVLVEAFGCDIAPEFIAACAYHSSARGQKPVWINLEYLSAESYVERCHRLPSPIQSGPAAGWTRWFFYPGFTPATGGLLREPDLMARREAFDRDAWRAATAPGADRDARWISLFCYEPPALPQLLAQCQERPTQLLVTPGRATAAVQSQIGPQRLFSKYEQLSISYLQPRPQPAFDEMLWASDLNLVRGEDSLVRALWAGQALVWHIYPQDDGAHHAKLHAFLDWLGAPPSLRRFHTAWNGLDAAPLALPGDDTLAEWTACVRGARERLLAQHDLASQLLGFVLEKQ
ncbi:MAG: elongation factor P maturation arginine rhamnosyltransferase EarP [Acidovorax sp.]|uniref:elongation factor P maturation arginine rhamnosyltransferase EarP n=1 Tax=Acidovorax sp. TaxID=1872122 RepID=UPI0039E639E2